MCYRVKFGSSAAKGVRINRRESSNLGSPVEPTPYCVGVADSLKASPHLHVLPRQIWYSSER